MKPTTVTPESHLSLEQTASSGARGTLVRVVWRLRLPEVKAHALLSLWLGSGHFQRLDDHLGVHDKVLGMLGNDMSARLGL